MGKVLVITNAKDPHADSVISALYEMGVEVVRFHPGECNADFNLSIGSKAYSIEIISSGRRFAAEEIVSVWYRRPDTVAAHSQHLANPDRQLVVRETNATLWGLYGHIDAVWISHPYCMHRAGLKLEQLAVARDAGFRVPAYRVSNDPRTLLAFADQFPGLVIKPIHELTGGFEQDGHHYSLRVKKIRGADLEKLLDSRPLSPIYLQRYVPKLCDVRVTVFGKTIFAVAIKQPENEEVVDFRPRCRELPHEPVEIPEELRQPILSYLRAFGLNFGAFDFVVDHDGEWYFLECNPNGQWLWLERLTGLPMVQTLARHLALIEPCPILSSQLPQGIQ